MSRPILPCLALLLLAACGRGSEEVAKLQTAIEGKRKVIASLEQQASALPALQQQIVQARQHLEDAGRFDGPNVVAILPETQVRSILESDVRGTGAEIAVESRGPLKGKFRWQARVTPPQKVWEVARAIVGDRSVEPTRLLELVERSGQIRGFYPLIPSEDLDEKPLPPVLPERPPVEAPSTGEGQALAAELARLEERRALLVTRVAEVQRARANLDKLRGREAVVEQVGHEMVRQRELLRVAMELRALLVRFREGSVAAELVFADREDAMAARDSQVLVTAGLTPTRSGERLEVVYEVPPTLPGFEARRLAFVQQP